MTSSYGKLSMCVVLLAGLAGACSSSSKSGSAGAAGTTGGAGTTGAAGTTGGAGTTGAAGTGVAIVTPTELVTAAGCGAIRLVVSNGTVYYTNNSAGTVNSVAATGGTPKVIAMNQNKPNPIAVDGTNVYWGNDGDHTVMKQAIAGGTAAVFVPAPADTSDPKNVAHALLVDSGTLYVGRGLDTYKIPTAGGPLTQLSHSLEGGLPGAFAYDGMHLFQTEIDHDAITRETTDGMQMGAITDGSVHALAPDRLAVSRAALATDAITISGKYVVWANGNGIEAHDKDDISAMATLFVVANSANYNTLTGFTISGDKIYMGEADSKTVDVVKLSFTVDPLNLPAADVLANDQPNPTELTADATNVYYTTTDASGVCKILKLAK